VRNNDEEEPGDSKDNETLLGLTRNWVRNWKGFMVMPKKTKRKILEKGLSDLSAEEGEEEEDESSSGITQFEQTTTFSTCGTSEWKRCDTTQQWPRAFTSPILLKTRRRREFGILFG
jgi:hypothetical protein